ncbi:MAG: hypothetical protein AUJ20_00275 [Comamonadaceae bacterium CG1_02_60_18]|nr:MAG: hypothetical protein AUJ20_00275 [Comamonadaceae bacterium CG1_02_60_18]PIQ56480.1 MAG: hypothetical protein COW02_01265 [Comamonadaceae bacterium CG12_big_fil_rev_8_21_14_0_65_59_15]
MIQSSQVNAPIEALGLTPVPAHGALASDQVEFESLGCVLVLGDDERAGPVAQRVGRHQPVVVFAPGVDKQAWGARVTAIGRKVTHLRGYLGAFHAEIRLGDDVTDVGAASPNPGRTFDLVLDLCQRPLITSEVKPLGYFALNADDKALDSIEVTLKALTGRFAKPRYFSYDAEMCAHGVSGVAGCQQCVSVCSADALHSTGQLIQIDPHLCQGCASCTLACPTGALTFKPMERASVDQRLQQLLSQTPADPIVVVHQGALDEPAHTALAEANAVALEVDPLPAFGDELWLRALAHGARALVLVDDAALPRRTRELLARKVAQMRTVLLALGDNPERVQFQPDNTLALWLTTDSKLIKPIAQRAPVAELASWSRFKRLAWIDSLRQFAAESQGIAQVLPAAATIGAVTVNRSTCTLCFACVNLCPTRALKDRHDTQPQLVFQESACVQCGLCVAGCPEKALSLSPRVAIRALTQMSSVVIHEDAFVKCTSCGTPFISKKMLESGLKMLQGNPSFDEGTRATLMTCPSCRQKEMLAM